MDGFIDIHSHILPGLDDGSKSIEESVDMLKSATSQGFKSIIVTPHYKSGLSKDFTIKVKKTIDKFNNILRKEELDLLLYIGCEIYYSETCLESLVANQLPTMAGSRYVLIEFHPMSDYKYVKNSIYKLRMEGFIPILAHGERYKFISDSLKEVRELIELGAHIQVNASSIVERTFRKQKKISRKLLKNRLVHYVSTDAHNNSTRPPLIKKCANFISEKYGEDYTKDLLINNPQKIINKIYD